MLCYQKFWNWGLELRPTSEKLKPCLYIAVEPEKMGLSYCSGVLFYYNLLYYILCGKTSLWYQNVDLDFDLLLKTLIFDITFEWE